ncbi:11717_t:CDS:2 [Racocetra fulgida]|uniref:11717_t:CDS:1 n=1 Tax=Racocetra fulgida TaxID=60492 RepID=A0A9N8VIZ9_9GLOM|nr:11717_t:CDS:2 [Racocetra fulgida]
MSLEKTPLYVSCKLVLYLRMMAMQIHEDIIGKSDPYIELWLDKNYKQKTTTKNNTVNPTYNETFTFLSNIHNGYADEWVNLPAMLGLMSKGKVHLILETAG